ncbi:MAG: LysR family transcriptional regulator [Galactobacter sp.]
MLDVTRLLLLRELEVRGTLAAVARVRGISTSAVSQQLRKLETEAGARLLEQRGRSLALTPAGQRLVRHADGVLSILEFAESELDAGRERVHGLVRVAGFATFARRHLPGLIRAVERDHPDVELTFHQLEPDEALEEVSGRRVDVAIVDEFPHIPERVDRNLERTFLQRDEVIPFLPVGTEPEIGSDELARLYWVVEPQGTEANAWVKRVCRKLGFEPRIFCESPDLTVHEEMVRSGVAAAFLPRMLLPAGRDFGLPRLRMGRDGEVESLWRDVHAVTRRSAVTSPAVRVVVESLKQIMPPVTRPPLQ